VANTRLILGDDFESGVVEFEVVSGNGSISEAGGLMTCALSAGQSGDWRAGKMARFPFTTREEDAYLHFETELNAFSGGANSQVWCGLHQNDANNVWLYIQGGTTNLFAYRITGGVFTSVGTFSGNPVTLPVKLGFIWNPRAQTVTWRVKTGATWVEIATVALAGFVPTAFFHYARNYSGTQAVSGSFSYVSGTAEEAGLENVDDGGRVASMEEELILTLPADVQTFLPGAQGAPAGENPGPVSTAAAGDAYALLDAGGPRHQPVSMGLRLPGSTAVPEDAGRAPVAGAQDAAPRVELILPTLFSSENQNAVQGKVGPFDADRRWQGADPQFNAQTPTLDGEGHQHLTTYMCHRSFVYDASGDAWNFPTAGSFTGYARNGKKYTNGVEDSGPVWAPWASEAASQDRAARDDFPLLSLIVVDRLELVIYDLDLYHSGGGLTVWMRFKLANDASNFYALGRGVESIRDAFMLNGVLYAGTKTNSWEVGGLIAVDFKSNGQDFLQLIRADGHWRGIAGKTIVNRNTTGLLINTGFSPSLRINNEDVHALAVSLDPTDPRRAWAAQVGEDGLEVIEFLSNAGAYQYWQNPSALVYNVGEIRKVAFGRSGEMWWSQQNRLIRAGLDYRRGVIVDPLTTGHGDVRGLISAAVELPETITSVAVGANHVYCGGASGIWRVHRVSLRWDLIYTIAGGGGGGVNAAPPAGEILPGETAAVTRIQVLRAPKTDYLLGSAWPLGGVFAVRCHDDVVIRSATHPTLQEAGALFARGFLVV